MTETDKDALIEQLRDELAAAHQTVDRLHSRLLDVEFGYEDELRDEEEDDTRPPSGGVSVEYDKFYMAQEIIDNHISDEMLKTAAKQAAVQIETIRDVYIDGAMLGISTMREALLDLISAQKGKKK